MRGRCSMGSWLEVFSSEFRAHAVRINEMPVWPWNMPLSVGLRLETPELLLLWSRLGLRSLWDFHVTQRVQVECNYGTRASKHAV